MLIPETPANEGARLAALKGLGLMYSPAEARFDRVTRLARRHFNVAVSLVSLVHESCQWFKSNQGLSACATPRELSFCGHAVAMDNTLVVPNALEDSRFADNPLVVLDPKIRFYAGHPIRDEQGHALGTLCLLDYAPRGFSMQDRQDLSDYAAWVSLLIAQAPPNSAARRLVFSLSENERAALLEPMLGVWNKGGLRAVLDVETVDTALKGVPLGLMTFELTDLSGLCMRFGSERVVEFRRFTHALVREHLPDSSSLGEVRDGLGLAVCPGLSVSDLRERLPALSAAFRQFTAESKGIQVNLECRINVLDRAIFNAEGIDALLDSLSSIY